MKIFKDENIQLNQHYENKVEAILAAGEILVENGYVAESYLQDMLAREEEVSTYIGNNIAIPHGIVKSVALKWKMLRFFVRQHLKKRFLKFLRRSSFNETGIAFWRWKYWDRLYC